MFFVEYSKKHLEMATCLRILSADAVEKAASGHPGMPLGMADVATVLFTQFLKFDADNPTWANRDRFILSAGHGSMLLYSLLHLTGYKDFPIEELKNFRQLGSKTPGHPEYGVGAGIETTTGPLGQGFASAVGMALGERLLAESFGSELIDHHTYVVASDGDLMEGISHEAASLAGHLKLKKLIVLYDDNGITIDGPTNLSFSEDAPKRFEAYGWHTLKIDGHNPEEIAAALKAAKNNDAPTLIACHTTIGFGAPTKQGTAGSHGAPLGTEEIAKLRENLNWPYAPFEIPEELQQIWYTVGTKGHASYLEWQKKFEASPLQNELKRRLKGDLPEDALPRLKNYIQQLIHDKKEVATRTSSQYVLEVLTESIPELIGGSSDLTPSNNTKTSHLTPISCESNVARYLHFGVREHAMAALMNGLSLYGGFIPYGGTFLVFSDYCRPAIRLSALMHQRVIYIMTHDSIGLGEDGPTHQPIEHLASLRAIPNLNVFRPADTIETAECWQQALEETSTPSVLALSRQKLPAVRCDKVEVEENLSAHGAYILRESSLKHKVTLIASGSEVHLALQASKRLEEESIGSVVVSAPCLELFEAQSGGYRKSVLGDAPRVIVEAGVRQPWDKYIRASDAHVTLSSFGASAPAKELFSHFKITADTVYQSAKKVLKEI